MSSPLGSGVVLNENDVRELEWVADVLEAAANGARPDQGYEQAARDLADLVRSKLPAQACPKCGR